MKESLKGMLRVSVSVCHWVYWLADKCSNSQSTWIV